MKRSSSAKATISSICSRIVRALEAVDRAVEVDVLAAGEVGVEAGAELEQRADAPAGLDAPGGRLDDPGDEAAAASSCRSRCGRRGRPPRPARSRARRPAAPRRPSPRRRPRATTSVLRACGTRLRIDAEAAGARARRGSRRALMRSTVPRALRRTIAGEDGDEGGIGVRHLDPLEPHARARARLLLRLGVEVPADLEVVGDEADRADEHVARRRRACSAARWSRMSGPSHGSPVGDSLWKENDQSSRSCARRRRARASRAAGPRTGRPRRGSARAGSAP